MVETLLKGIACLITGIDYAVHKDFWWSWLNFLLCGWAALSEAALGMLQLGGPVELSGGLGICRAPRKECSLNQN